MSEPNVNPSVGVSRRSFLDSLGRWTAVAAAAVVGVLAFPKKAWAAPTVTISYPQNSPPAVSGAQFNTAEWCSSGVRATYAAPLTRGGTVIANGTSFNPGPDYQWGFSFSGVPHSNSANDTTLTVTATAENGKGSDSKTLSIS